MVIVATPATEDDEETEDSEDDDDSDDMEEGLSLDCAKALSGSSATDNEIRANRRMRRRGVTVRTVAAENSSGTSQRGDFAA